MTVVAGEVAGEGPAVGPFGFELGFGAFGGGELACGSELGFVIFAQGITLAGGVGADPVCLERPQVVAAVTNPVWEPRRDRHGQYREHVVASLAACPWARVVKVSDFTDNAAGLFHTTGPKVPELARKYRPLIPILRELVLRPDTPLQPEAKDIIIRQLGKT